MFKALPEKLSDLLLETLDDLDAAENDDGIVIDMDKWHEVSDDACTICLAGCKMRGMGVSDKEKWGPERFDDATRGRLYALDCLRTGNFAVAFMHIGRDKPAKLPNCITVVHYDRYPQQFKQDMRDMAAMLKNVGE